MISLKLKLTFTNIIGAIGLFMSIAKEVDAGIYACAAMILGRSTAKYFGKKNA
ncbi:MAG: hypothetical protein GY861_14035 [bacterium]|nr:hypothetical protein [bacterium]